VVEKGHFNTFVDNREKGYSWHKLEKKRMWKKTLKIYVFVQKIFVDRKVKITYNDIAWFLD